MSDLTASTTDAAPSSNWRRLRHTPVRDLIRGRVTGRLDLPARVAAAGLPQPVQLVILDVARRTRLWRLEKVDVADELIAHFQDGLHAGRTPDELVERFGDPARVARLVRRAKKRHRPRLWRAFVRLWQALGLFVLALAALYAIAAIRFFSGRPSPSRDYLAELNAPVLAAPVADRAWPLYRQALVELGQTPSPRTSREPLPGEIGWDQIESYLAQHGPAIALARRGASRPLLGYVISNRIDEADQELWTRSGRQVPGPSGMPGLLGVLLPYVAESRNLGRVLGWDLLQGGREGDGERVCADARATLDLARHVAEAPFAINQLVCWAMTGRLIDQLGEVLRSNPQALSDDQLQALAHEIGASHPSIFEARLEGEHMAFDDIMQHLFTDDGDGDGRMTSEGLQWLTSTVTSGPIEAWWKELPGPAFASVLAGRRSMSARYEQVMATMLAEFQTPLWRFNGSTADAELEAMMQSPIERFRYFPVAVLTPALARMHVVAEQLVQERDVLLVAIALEIHHRRHGQWPAALSELSPALLPAPPLDCFSGQAIGYRLVDGRPVVYSIGADRDDDGGVPPRDADGLIMNQRAKHWLTPGVIEQMKQDASPELPDGDWILWPKPQDPIDWITEDAPPPIVSHFAP